MNVDTLIQDDLVNFRRNLIVGFKEQHPHIFTILENVFSGRKNMVGIQVTEDGNVIGKYTLMMDEGQGVMNHHEFLHGGSLNIHLL